MSRDQYTLSDPTKLYADIETHEQSQPGSGLDANLDGRKALITGGDSVIGAATAIAFAREGSDVAIS